jgi:uncharacterized membrane protein
MNNLAERIVSLALLGAGDLIDRAVRFYRKNFWTFFLIAAPPIATIGIAPEPRKSQKRRLVPK